uniref:Uncharacterized protein n=1 Tax=Amphimedon queenslandica TaxID=400682 RepID=A0A1X7VBF4_AMPQE
MEQEKRKKLELKKAREKERKRRQFEKQQARNERAKNKTIKKTGPAARGATDGETRAVGRGTATHNNVISTNGFTSSMPFEVTEASMDI